MDERTEIEQQIRRWATAVHAGDLEAVAADRAHDIVMFDVVPPERGIRGIASYRDVWPPFFEWQRQGAVFEIDELEISVGVDVAHGWLLLRCGTRDELESEPDRRLRISLGLRRQEGRWLVTHEHHSFTHPDGESG